MTKHFFKGCLAVLIVTILLVSCEKTTNLVPQHEEIRVPTKTMTVLGRKLPNPYSPENVKLAWENLKKSNPDVTKGINMDFAPTHLYVKFAPKDVNELKLLKSTYGHDLYDIPAFYEYTTMGDYYTDPAIKEGMPTYHYTTLAIDAKLPSNIEYEILEQLILLNIEEKVNNSLKYNEAFYDALLNEMYSVTRLTEYMYETTGSRGVLSKWRPSGRLTYFASGTPYANVYVRLHDFLFIPMINTGMTSNQDGNYNLGRDIRGKVFYRVHWGTNDFSVSNFINRAYNAHRF